MQQWHEGAPIPAQDVQQRGWCHHDRRAVPGPWPSLGVPGGRPAQQLPAEHEPGRLAVAHERPVGEVVDRCLVLQLGARAGIDALAVELQVDRVGSRPARDEARARSRRGARSRRAGRARRAGGPPASAVTSSRKNSSVNFPGCSLGPRSQPRNSSRHAIQRRVAVPPPDAPGIVMHAPAIPVEEAARRVCDELGERRHAILQWHPAATPSREGCLSSAMVVGSYPAVKRCGCVRY